MSTEHLAKAGTDMHTPASEPDEHRSAVRVLTSSIPWPVQRLLWQITVGVLFLLGWEYFPRVHFISSHVRFLDAFFISSPVEVWKSLVGIVSGHNQNGITLWPYLWVTVKATLIGTSSGLVAGAIFGLISSNNLRLSEVVRPYLILANSVPRVAIIPIFVVMMGPTVGASVVSVIAVVFFIAFFNAFEGGVSIREPLIENAILLGASPFDVMRVIRLPMVLIWTFASIPNAISFGLVVAVTTELIAGIAGMGQLILNATANVQVALTFAIIVALSIVGLLLYGMAMALRAKIVRWKT